MRLQFASFRPVVSLVVVVNVTEQKICIALVDDQPDITTNAHRPKVFVLRPVEFVKTHAGVGRIDLQIERGCLDRLLFVASKATEAVSESVGDAEVHQQPIFLICVGDSDEDRSFKALSISHL